QSRGRAHHGGAAPPQRKAGRVGAGREQRPHADPEPAPDLGRTNLPRTMSLSGHLKIDVVQRYLAGTLGEEARRATLAHIESCEECRSLLLAASSLMTRAP